MLAYVFLYAKDSLKVVEQRMQYSVRLRMSWVYMLRIQFRDSSHGTGPELMLCLG